MSKVVYAVKTIPETKLRIDRLSSFSGVEKGELVTMIIEAVYNTCYQPDSRDLTASKIMEFENILNEIM